MRYCVAPAFRTGTLIVSLFAIVATCSGCSAVGPKPWEKDIMARPEMQITAYALQASADDHIYFSKEASSGGRGFAGGGCGCN
jgi:hypothetical protein